MKVIKAQKGGFCFGVRRAVDAVQQNLATGAPVYTLGPVIHNPDVVAALARQGAQAVPTPEDAPPGSTLVIRSHGVAPDVLARCARTAHTLVDATCPFVKRIHAKVTQCVAEGLPVIIAGERDHPEVEGIRGWAQGRAQVVSSAQEALALPVMEAACVVAQTTIPAQLWQQITDALATRVRKLERFDSICNATAERQSEAARMARELPCLVVVGGRNSSNTRKLYELCRGIQPNTFWVQHAAELDLNMLARFDTAGIISGASTPDWIIEEVTNTMSDIEIRGTDAVQDVPVQEDAPAAVEPQAQAPEQVEPTAHTPEQPAPDQDQPVQAQSEGEEPAALTADEKFAADLEKTLRVVKPGQVVTGNVVQVTPDSVCVNIGYKADGILTVAEYSSDSIDLTTVLQEGDPITVEIIKINDGEGNVVLSRKSLEVKQCWQELVEYHEAGSFVRGTIKSTIKGGVLAQIGVIQAFIPASQIALGFAPDLSIYVGQELDLKIIEMERARRRVVASRRAVLEAEKEAREAGIWEELKQHEGEITTGAVRRLVDFGAFVEVAGLDGLVHVTDISWFRVKHPSDVLKIGEEVDVVILKVDIERKRLSLGIKQVKPHPWKIAAQTYPIGTVVEGKVVRITKFGAFVELERGVDALVHISQIANRRIENVEDVLTVGDIVQAKVLDVNPEQRRISLSIRAAQQEQEQDAPAYTAQSDMDYSAAVYSTDSPTADYQPDED